MRGRIVASTEHVSMMKHTKPNASADNIDRTNTSEQPVLRGNNAVFGDDGDDGRPGKQESYDEGKDPQNFDAGCVFMHQSSSAASCPQAPSISFPRVSRRVVGTPASLSRDRKSTRLNSSHVSTSYAVFCLKKQ